LTPQGERRPIPHILIGVATQPYESVDNRRRIVWHQAMYGCVSEVGARMLDEWQQRLNCTWTRSVPQGKDCGLHYLIVRIAQRA
jgi:hypothetical protein